jgi:predicted pyridoxine 5'-phosphate oxidase superfamily flavin-nucleotide-binding protein
MITQPIKNLIENLSYVFVSTADKSGQPHVAIGEQVTISGDSLLIFENWFCPATLQNIAFNTHVSVVAVLPDTGKGYQMLGSVIRSADTLILDGYDPDATMSAKPQVLTRFTVKVDKIFEFTSGIHTDMPLAD